MSLVVTLALLLAQSIDTSAASTLVLSSKSQSFAHVPVGATSDPKNVTLTNKGAAAVHLASIGLSGPNPSDFVHSSTCGKRIGAGKSCRVSVQFAPTTPGGRSARLQITTGSGATSDVSLDGQAILSAGTFDLTPTAYDVVQSDGTIKLRVMRGGDSQGAVSVRYRTIDGTATSGAEYTSSTGMLQWADGETGRKSFSIPIGASPFTGTRNFVVKLDQNIGGANLGDASATVTITGSGGDTGPPAGSASDLTARLGRPSRLLIGLGTGSEPSDIKGQSIKPDLYDRYLTGVGDGDWTTWNTPAGQYVNGVAGDADSLGAVPMFTLYGMAAKGDGNLAPLNDRNFMVRYWSNARLLFQRLALYNKPAVVNLEPDFWGYVEQKSGGASPGQTFAYVNVAPDCAALPNDAGGMASCLILLARQYAPKVLIGLPPSDWGADSPTKVVTFMRQLGAQRGDFTVMQTLDADAGCFEVRAGSCTRGGTGWYWDESNRTHPNFTDHLALAKIYHDGIGLPLLWWQTPLGVPSPQPGGTWRHYRDNRAHYFLTYASQLVDVGGFAVVFSNGDYLTGITTDGGQFKTLTTKYFASPAALP